MYFYWKMSFKSNKQLESNEKGCYCLRTNNTTLVIQSIWMLIILSLKFHLVLAIYFLLVNTKGFAGYHLGTDDENYWWMIVGWGHKSLALGERLKLHLI